MRGISTAVFEQYLQIGRIGEVCGAVVEFSESSCQGVVNGSLMFTVLGYPSTTGGINLGEGSYL